MNVRTIILLAMGFGFSAVSNAVELRGDLAPFAKSGVSVERLIYHCSALALLIAAAACFIGAALPLFMKKRG